MATKKQAKKAVAKPAAKKPAAKAPVAKAAAKKKSDVAVSEDGLTTTRTYADGRTGTVTHQSPEAAKQYVASLEK